MKILMLPLLLLTLAFSLCWQEAAPVKRARRVQEGVWGGEHIRLTVERNGARLEYDCAHGSIDQQMKLDRNGRFNATGYHVNESGGPDIQDRLHAKRPAKYLGQVTGNEMALDIVLTDSNEKLGSFMVTYGNRGDIFKCK